MLKEAGFAPDGSPPIADLRTRDHGDGRYGRACVGGHQEEKATPRIAVVAPQQDHPASGSAGQLKITTSSNTTQAVMKTPTLQMPVIAMTM